MFVANLAVGVHARELLVAFAAGADDDLADPACGVGGAGGRLRCESFVTWWWR
jgi:hypothetical protein